MARISTIDEALDYIYSFTNLERSVRNSKAFKPHYHLDAMEKLLEATGNPHQGIKAIHIAGTKGKGSTASFVTSILQSQGYSTLRFTSPHVIKTNERITFNNESISDEELVDITQNLRELFEKTALEPTTFELFFLIFLLYGRLRKPDYFVIETGLGGRLDCTNVITPLVSIITSIGLEHTEILGATINAIAKEKAGIIKKNIPVVVASQKHRCVKVFKQHAQEKKSDFYYVPDLFSVKNIDTSNNYLSFIFQKLDIHKNAKKDDEIKIELDLLGQHQIANFLTAYQSCVLALKQTEPLELPKRLITQLNGRIQMIRENPLLYADVAHTIDSAKELVDTLMKKQPHVKFVVVLGLAEDKKAKQIIKILSKIAKFFIITSLEDKRNVQINQMFLYAKKYRKNSMVMLDQKEAFKQAIISHDEFLLVGSFYLIGPFISFFQATSSSN